MNAPYNLNCTQPVPRSTIFFPYFSLQLFHIQQESTCGGGQTLFVDGFSLAERFKTICPDGYDFLATYPLEAEYVHDTSDPHSQYINKDVAFKHCPQRYSSK